jgi:hypothetical protein
MQMATVLGTLIAAIGKYVEEETQAGFFVKPPPPRVPGAESKDNSSRLVAEL